MDIYKHIVYNPYMKNIQSVIQEAQDLENLEGGKEWQFVRSQPVTEYEWVAIFEKWQNEITGTPTQEPKDPNTKKQSKEWNCHW